MKILVTSLPDLKRINPQRPHHILRYLSRKHEITVLSVKAWWLKEKKDDYLENCISDLDIVYLTEKKLNPVLQELSILYKFEQLNTQYNFDKYSLHLNFNSLIAGHYISNKMRAKKIPTVFDIADDLPEIIKTSSQMPYLLRNIGYYFGNFMFNKCINTSDRNTLVTESLLHTYNFPSDSSKIIPNGVDTELFSFRNTEVFKKKLGINQDFVLGFIGVLSEWVNFNPTFIAIRSLIDSGFKIKMLIIGDGYKLEDFKESARKNGIFENVMFTGSVLTSDLPIYISCMDICMISRKTTIDSHNSFPLKLLEYMACGKPVISVALNGVKETIKDRVLYATSSEEIKEQIIKLYYDREKAERMGSEGMKFVHDNYSWQKICSNFEKILMGVVNESTS
jgi:glycosyltransferase involved in cell wall biosynthesis